jgi:signal transduction histidine kinase/CHASE2 domain-containing sensor protein
MQFLKGQSFRNGLLVGCISALLITIVSGFGLWQQLDGWATNLLYVPEASSGNVVIVAIDDQSLGAYGRSLTSWSRGRHADLINVLAAGGARVVAFDVLFAESGGGDAQLMTALEAAALSQTRTRVILGAAGSFKASTGPLNYQSETPPHRPLRERAWGIGHINARPDPGGYVRRMPVLVGQPDGQSPRLSLSAMAVLAYLRIPAGQIDDLLKVDWQAQQIALTPQHILPVNAQGEMLVRFFGPPNTIPRYSYQDVLTGDVPPETFTGKIVLVGWHNAAGNTDQYLVPLTTGSALMSGVEIHANAIETILSRLPLTEMPTAHKWALNVLLALLSGILFLRLRWRLALPAYILLMLGVFIAASLWFSLARVVVSPFHSWIALSCSAAIGLVVNLRTEAMYRRRNQKLLQSATSLLENREMLGQVLDLVAAEVKKLTRSQDTVIWLWNQDKPDAEALEVALATVPSQSIKGLLDAAQKAVLNTKTMRNPKLMVTPLTFQRRPLGVIATTASKNAVFGREQVDLFRRFAQQVAPTIGYAKLYTEQMRQKRLIEAVLSSTPDPVVVLNREGKIDRTNEAGEVLFDGKEGMPFPQALQSCGVREEIVDEVEAALHIGKPFGNEFALRDRTFVLQAAHLQFDSDGWVLLLHDITDLKALDQMKTQMMRMTSHDLKNPLMVISGFVELLLEDELKTNHREMVEMIGSSSKQMLGIITDLLNIERARSGQLAFHPVDLSELVLEIAMEHEYQAGQKKIALKIEEANETIVVNADARQLRESLVNLIGNAIKYTPEGGTVTVKLRSEGKTAHFFVRDTGYGISQEGQAKLFQPFYRVRTRDTASIPGTGLGLSLAKTVIDAHHGRLWVESSEGKGSTFYVDLPMAEQQPIPADAL